MLKTKTLTSMDDFGPARIEDTGSKILFITGNKTVSVKKRGLLRTSQELFAKLADVSMCQTSYTFLYKERIDNLAEIIRWT